MEYPIPVTMDLDEGRFMRIGCVGCQRDVRATITIAVPFRMYDIALDCDECGEQLVVADMFMGVKRVWRRTA